MNGDGKPDLLVANVCGGSGNCANPGQQPGSVGVLLGNGDGTFQPAAAYGSGGNGTSSVVVADVNGDGKLDLLATNLCASSSNCATPGLHPGSVGVLLGNGDGTFQPAVTYGSGGRYAESVAVGDVNADGQPDLLVANYCVNGPCTSGAVGVLLHSSSPSSTFECRTGDQ